MNIVFGRTHQIHIVLHEYPELIIPSPQKHEFSAPSGTPESCPKTRGGAALKEAQTPWQIAPFRCSGRPAASQDSRANSFLRQAPQFGALLSRRNAPGSTRLKRWPRRGNFRLRFPKFLPRSAACVRHS